MVDSKIVVHVLMTHYQKKGLGASAAAYETFSVKGEGIVDKGTKGRVLEVQVSGHQH